MAHTICKKDEAYFKSMAQEVSDFLKGQDDKIIDDLKSKMAVAAQSMEFERAAEYRDLIQAIGTLRTKQRVMAMISKIAMSLATMWIRAGCVCRFSLFVRASSSSAMSISSLLQ